MVNLAPVETRFVSVLAQATPERSLLERLRPTQRGAVMLALVGLVVLALGLMLFAYLTGRWVRKRMRSTVCPTTPISGDDWARRKLPSAEDTIG